MYTTYTLHISKQMLLHCEKHIANGMMHYNTEVSYILTIAMLAIGYIASSHIIIIIMSHH